VSSRARGGPGYSMHTIYSLLGSLHNSATPENEKTNASFAVTCVALAEKLHAHDGKDEDDDAEYEGEVAQRPDGLPHDGDEEVQRGPRLRQLENSQLETSV
jgi:hypothetical protein